jgi:predicted transcriptional regulator
MVITLSPDLTAALNELARKQGVNPDVLALNALRDRFLAPALKVKPQDEWGRGLLAAASDCGISLSNEAVSSEGLYE